MQSAKAASRKSKKCWGSEEPSILIWGIFFEIITAARHGVDPLGMVYRILVGRSSGQMYFILVLIELTLITPLLYKATESKKWSALILAVTPLYLACYSVRHYYFIQRSDWIGRDSAAWLLYYYIGILVKKHGWE